jgi:hypothetical protein
LEQTIEPEICPSAILPPNEAGRRILEKKRKYENRHRGAALTKKFVSARICGLVSKPLITQGIRILLRGNGAFHLGGFSTGLGRFIQAAPGGVPWDRWNTVYRTLSGFPAAFLRLFCPACSSNADFYRLCWFVRGGLA